jgi:hypothetical protein
MESRGKIGPMEWDVAVGSLDDVGDGGVFLGLIGGSPSLCIKAHSHDKQNVSIAQLYPQPEPNLRSAEELSQRDGVVLIPECIFTTRHHPLYWRCQHTSELAPGTLFVWEDTAGLAVRSRRAVAYLNMKSGNVRDDLDFTTLSTRWWAITRAGADFFVYQDVLKEKAPTLL